MRMKALTLATLATLWAGCRNPDWKSASTDASVSSAPAAGDAGERTGRGSDAASRASDGSLPDAEKNDAAARTPPDASLERAEAGSPDTSPAQPDGSVGGPPAQTPPTNPPDPAPKPTPPQLPVDLTPPAGPTLGVVGDVALIGDLDGDGARDDYAVWRPSEGTWWAIRTDGSAIFSRRHWGEPGDLPLIGDFDSDGKINDLGVYRPSEGIWYLTRWTSIPENDPKGVTTGEPIVRPFGLTGDIPLVGDFDSDGRFDDMGLWRPSNGTWWGKRTDDSGIFDLRKWGLTGDVPVVGDFDSDGKVNDIGVYRPSTGSWHLIRWAAAGIGVDVAPTAEPIAAVTLWGMSSDVPLVGDFDGDGRFDNLGLWRPSDGTWWAKRTDATVLFRERRFGLPGDTPLVAAFDADHALDDLVVWRPSEGRWYTWKAN